MGYEEGQRLQGSDGNIYVVRGGVPTLETPASSAATVVTKRANPLEAPKNAADLLNAQLNGQRTAQQIAQDAATADANRRIAEANAQRADAEARMAQIQAAQGNQGKGLSPEVRKDALAAYQSAEQLDRLISEIEAKFVAGPGSTSGIAGLRDYVGTPANDQFDKAGQSARGLVKQALGFTGGENNTAGESAQNIGPYIPQSSDYDATARDKIERLKDLRDSARARAIAQLGGVPDANGNVSPVAFSVATGETRVERDPKRASVLNALIRGGADIDTINTTMVGMGGTPVNPGDIEAARAYLRKNPGYKGSLAEATNTVQNNALNRVSATPLASAVTGVVNGLTAGFLDEGAGAITSLVTGQDRSQAIAEADRAKQLSASANPWSSLAGNVIGNMGAMLTGGAAAGRLGVTAALGKASPWLADIGIGGLTGAGESNSDRLLGAGVGATAATVGRGLFGGGMKALGKFTRGVQNPDVRQLAREGVPLTGGQMLGGSFKAIEDKLTSAPMVGDLINNRRAEGLRAWNAARFDEGMAPIGGLRNAGTGEQAVEAARGAAGQSYDNTLGGVIFPYDAQARVDVTGATHLGSRIPTLGDEFLHTMNTKVLPNIDPNTMEVTGKGLQAIKQALRKDTRSFATQPRGADLGDAFGQVETAFDRAAERAVPGIGDGLRNSNAAYRNLSVLADAVRAGKNTDGLFTPAQLGTAAAANAKKYNGGIAAATSDRPFFASQRAAQNVLPSKVPDSGTVGRGAMLAAPAGLVAAGGGIGAGAGYVGGDTQSGAGIGGGATAGALATAALLNSPAARIALAKSLLERSPLFERLGNAAIDKAAPRFGLFGRAVGPALLSQQ